MDIEYNYFGDSFTITPRLAFALTGLIVILIIVAFFLLLLLILYWLQDSDGDGLSLLTETILGSSDNEKDLYIEVDWVLGCSPTKDVSDADGDNKTNEYVAFDYMKTYYKKIHDINVHFDTGPSSTNLNFIISEYNRIVTNPYDMQIINYDYHDQKFTHVYLCFVERTYYGIINIKEAPGVSFPSAGAFIGKSSTQTQYSSETDDRSVIGEVHAVMHEIGHCIRAGLHDDEGVILGQDNPFTTEVHSENLNNNPDPDWIWGESFSAMCGPWFNQLQNDFYQDINCLYTGGRQLPNINERFLINYDEADGPENDDWDTVNLKLKYSVLLEY